MPNPKEPSAEAMDLVQAHTPATYWARGVEFALAIDTFAASAVARAVAEERARCIADCIAVCRSHEVQDRDESGCVVNVWPTESSATAMDCAAAIRARAQEKTT